MAEEVRTAPRQEENVLLEWVAPSRPFQLRTRDFYKTAGTLIFLIIVILLFVGEIMLIMTVLSIFFVIYVLFSVPPEEIKNKMTTLGIETAGHFHKWEELYEFWFEEKYGQKMVIIRTLLGFPSHLHLLLGNVSQEKIKKVMSSRIPYRETPEKTFADRASEWLVKKIPLDRAS